ncbi:hypothetical protein PHYBOEH_001738 [Phytophthora boehmeriae]|uniref:Uncharacterized protein n=1 Tax=Phytophthora boehmeriae TaxID=109152 RepID=A0A8T1X559_9STRA|nr:hypothetical protein PHYBOEH_001738 [Phytophthora boehmeriae]
MNDEERKALAEARGRVANLRAMFNKGSVTNTTAPASFRRVALKPTSSSESLSDLSIQQKKARDEEERRTVQEAKDSLSQFTSDGKTFEAEKRDQQRRLHKKHKEHEQEAQLAMRNFATGGNSLFEEQLEEKKRLQQVEKQKEQFAKTAKSNFSSPDFDHAYVHAKEVAQVEKQAEEKAKAALLQYDQHDVTHEYVMKNGMRVLKSAERTPTAKRYPFTDPAARIKKPSPAALKALARFQEQLAENKVREEQKASDEAARKASWESTRKMSIESAGSMGSTHKQSFDEIDINQIKASVDEAKLDVRSAAQKFAEMDRKAAELAKQNKKPMTFNGVSYGHRGRAFRTKDQDRKEITRKNEMAARIQSLVRGNIARNAYSDKVTAATRIAIRIQTEFRRRRAEKQVQSLRQQLEREQVSAVVIQTILRGRSQWKRYQAEVTARKAAAILLQSVIRSRQAQANYNKRIVAARALEDLKNNMATKIQSQWRGSVARSEVSTLRAEVAAKAAAEAAAEEEARLARQAEVENSMATKIQSQWRSSVARSEVSAIRAQAIADVHNQLAKIENLTAVRIQSRWRGVLARTRVESLIAQARATKEAKAAEEAEAAKAELEDAMAVKLQSQWRSVMATKESLREAREQEAALEAAKAAEAAEEARAAEEAKAAELARAAEEAKAAEEAEAAKAELEDAMAVKLQSQWRSVMATKEVQSLREAREQEAALEAAKAAEAAEEARAAEEAKAAELARAAEEAKAAEEAEAAKAELEAAMAEAAKFSRDAEEGETSTISEYLYSGVKASTAKLTVEELHTENTQVRRQPTMAELQLLSESGRFSHLSSDDSDDDSDYEDAASFVDAPLAPEVPVSFYSGKDVAEHGDIVTGTDSDQSRSSSSVHNDSFAHVSTSPMSSSVGASSLEYAFNYDDNRSDVSSDYFVDAVEEIKSTVHISDIEENSVNSDSLAFEIASSSDVSATVSDTTPLPPVVHAVPSTGENDNQRLSSVSDYDRPSSVRSGSFFQEPTFDASPRASHNSSLLSFGSRSRDDSYARSSEDSYADLDRSRGDSYADIDRPRGDSYADVFRSRDNSYAESDVFQSADTSAAETRPRDDSYADVPDKSDAESMNDLEEIQDDPKYFDTDSDRGSSFISDSPASAQKSSDIEPLDVEQITRQKSGSRWRASSVLSKLSSRRSSKPSSSPTSSIEDDKDDDKDDEPKKPRSASTLSSVSSSVAGSVAGLINRKLSVPTNNTSSAKSVESEMDETCLYSPPAQASKNKSRFGRFAAPSVAKPAFTKRFAWKRRGTDENDENADNTQAA